MFNINYTYIIIASLIVANFVLLIIVFMSRAPKKTPGQNRRQSPLQDRRSKKTKAKNYPRSALCIRWKTNIS